MTKFKKGLLAVLLVPACLMCAGCGGADTAASRNAIDDCANYNLSDRGFGECKLRLRDGRRVTCVIMSGYRKGGLSCDWEHAAKAE